MKMYHFEVYPLRWLGLLILLGVILWGCQTVSPRQQFVNACASAGEAMAQVIALKRADKIDQPTFNSLDDLYDAAVATCDTMPASDNAADIALAKVNEFLARAAGVTGQSYGSY